MTSASIDIYLIRSLIPPSRSLVADHLRVESLIRRTELLGYDWRLPC